MRRFIPRFALLLAATLIPGAELNPTPTGLRPQAMTFPAQLPPASAPSLRGAFLPLLRRLSAAQYSDFRTPLARGLRYQVPPHGIYGAPRHYGGHQGVDLAAPEGSTVRAARAGRVTLVHRFSLLKDWGRGYGGLVILRHDDGSQTWYSHMEKIAVRSGQRVERGTRLGAVGAKDNGDSSGPHLHFMLFGPDGKLRDPSPILPAAAFPRR